MKKMEIWEGFVHVIHSMNAIHVINFISMFCTCYAVNERHTWYKFHFNVLYMLYSQWMPYMLEISFQCLVHVMQSMNAIHVINFISMNAMLYSAKPCFEVNSFGRFGTPNNIYRYKKKDLLYGCTCKYSLLKVSLWYIQWIDHWHVYCDAAIRVSRGRFICVPPITQIQPIICSAHAFLYNSLGLCL